MKTYEQKCINNKKKLKRFLKELKKKVNINEENKEIILDLLNSKIACISHNITFKKREFGFNKHNDRNQFREHLKDFVKKELNLETFLTKK